MKSKKTIEQAAVENQVTSSKTLPKWAKITIIVVCATVVAVGLFTASWHLSLYIMGFENDIKLEDMQVENLDSIALYNENNGTAICHFEGSKDTTAYYYNDKIIFIEETSTIDGIDVSLLVIVTENTYGYDFVDNVNSKYFVSINDAPKSQLEEFDVQVFGGKTYVSFSNDTHEYYIIINSTETEVWKDVVSKLLK